jgi:putative addiction module component (TIGR02574 family)
MSSEIHKIFDDARKLPNEQRAALVLQLLDTLGRDDPGIEEAWKDEIRNRLEELRSGVVQTVPWEEARKRIFAR